LNKKNPKILAIIPARKGSKGIPGKNIKMICRKPLIAWAVIAAKKSGVFDRIVLTTDDKKIADIGRKFGAEVPFLRPAKLARDETPMLPVLQHVVLWLETNEGYFPDFVALLEPTSVCRRPFHIQEAANLILKSNIDSIIGVSEIPAEFSAHWQFSVGKENKAKLVSNKPIRNIISRRQSLPKTYRRNGVIYIFKKNLLFGPNPNLYGNNTRALIVDEKYSQDINNPEDLAMAKIALKKILEEESHTI